MLLHRRLSVCRPLYIRRGVYFRVGGGAELPVITIVPVQALKSGFEKKRIPKRLYYLPNCILGISGTLTGAG
jgi:hypothetical protein